MRLVLAQCSADYLGRLSAHLLSAMRLIMVKADGSVDVDANAAAYEPLNADVGAAQAAKIGKLSPHEGQGNSQRFRPTGDMPVFPW